jgi:hypothetical protein
MKTDSSGTLMSPPWRLAACSLVAFLALVLGGGPSAARANEIVIEHSAVRKMLMDEIFTDNGKLQLLRESKCQSAYLDSPEVSIAGGRVRIRTRLVSLLALEIDGQCTAAPDALQVTASARPYFSGENLGLTDVKIDEVSREEYRVLLQVFVQQLLPRAFHINLRQGLQRMLSDAGTSYDVTVRQLAVTDLSAENNRLTARISFALSAR